jgi:hypothetical protein
MDKKEEFYKRKQCHYFKVFGIESNETNNFKKTIFQTLVSSELFGSILVANELDLAINTNIHHILMKTDSNKV